VERQGEGWVNYTSSIPSGNVPADINRDWMLKHPLLQDREERNINIIRNKHVMKKDRAVSRPKSTCQNAYVVGKMRRSNCMDQGKSSGAASSTLSLSNSPVHVLRLQEDSPYKLTLKLRELLERVDYQSQTSGIRVLND